MRFLALLFGLLAVVLTCTTAALFLVLLGPGLVAAGVGVPGLVLAWLVGTVASVLAGLVAWGVWLSLTTMLLRGPQYVRWSPPQGSSLGSWAASSWRRGEIAGTAQGVRIFGLEIALLGSLAAH